MASSNLYLTVAASTIRVALRSAFLITSLITAFFGHRACTLYNKIKLLNGQDVTLASMTGWIRGISVFKTIFDLRGLPGGSMGLLMILSAMIGLVSDLTVTYFIKSDMYTSTCPFTTGLVLQPQNAHNYPSPFSSAYATASAAQLVSDRNCDGTLGVYKKAGSSRFFCADQTDILGGWTCEDSGNPITYKQSDDMTISKDLITKKLLYNYVSSSSISSQSPSRTYQNVFLSTSTNATGQAWNFRAAIARETLDKATNAKLMQPYTCNLKSTKSDTTSIIDKTLRAIDTSHFSSDYQFLIAGAMYDGPNTETAINNPAITLEWILNSAIMVSGGAQNATQKPMPEDTTEGCLVQVAILPKAFLAMLAVAVLIAVFVLVDWFILELRKRHACRVRDWDMSAPRGQSKDLVDHMPDGLLDWMVQAIHESNPVLEKPRTYHLHDWKLSAKLGLGQQLLITHKKSEV